MNHRRGKLLLRAAQDALECALRRVHLLGTSHLLKPLHMFQAQSFKLFGSELRHFELAHRDAARLVVGDTRCETDTAETSWARHTTMIARSYFFCLSDAARSARIAFNSSSRNCSCSSGEDGAFPQKNGQPQRRPPEPFPRPKNPRRWPCCPHGPAPLPVIGPYPSGPVPSIAGIVWVGKK